MLDETKSHNVDALSLLYMDAIYAQPALRSMLG